MCKFRLCMILYFIHFTLCWFFFFPQWSSGHPDVLHGSQSANIHVCSGSVFVFLCVVLIIKKKKLTLVYHSLRITTLLVHDTFIISNNAAGETFEGGGVSASTEKGKWRQEDLKYMKRFSICLVKILFLWLNQVIGWMLMWTTISITLVLVLCVTHVDFPSYHYMCSV